MHKKGKNKPSKNKCIFCQQEKKMSDEHIWGDWLKQYVKPTMNKHSMGRRIINLPGTPDKTHVYHNRAGDPLHKKIKLVCVDCNNTWLSQIQNAAKPFLIPLIQGKKTVVGRQAQESIAAYCTMATMTAEYLCREEKSRAIPQSERFWLKNNRTSPPNWRIWIAPYQRKNWVGQWCYNSLPIIDSSEGIGVTDKNLPPSNTQMTTFVIGQLYVHAMSAADLSIVSRWNWNGLPSANTLLLQIFPAQGRNSIIVWPTRILSDAEASGISTAFIRFIDKIALDLVGNRIF